MLRREKKDPEDSSAVLNIVYLTSLRLRPTRRSRWGERATGEVAPVAGTSGVRATRSPHDDRQAVGWSVQTPRRPGPPMSIPRTVAEIVAEHVTLSWK
ncbi:MAG TPA: hypothetical protein VGW38_23375, partial [Chloroflexota bacterium]|nr:hypothetical protein [Chloroflexota bacterium]